MPKFFSHFRKTGALINDPEGLELPDLDAAREEASDGIRQMIAAKVVADEEADVVVSRSATISVTIWRRSLLQRRFRPPFLCRRNLRS
jgi:hypothetical protein